MFIEKCFSTDLAARLVKYKFIEPWIPEAPIPAAPLGAEGVSIEDPVPPKPVTGEQVQLGWQMGRVGLWLGSDIIQPNPTQHNPLLACLAWVGLGY